MAIVTSPEVPPTGNLMARGRTQRGGMNGLKQLLAKHEIHRKSMNGGSNDHQLPFLVEDQSMQRITSSRN